MANKTGLLILTNPSKIAGLLPAVLKHVNNTLYIHWNPHNKIVESTQWPTHSQTIGKIYYQASIHCQNLDVRVLLAAIKNPSLLIETCRQIDILLCDKPYNDRELDCFKSKLKNIAVKCPIITLKEDLVRSTPEENVIKSETTNNKVYENVVLGGTFDRLHDGHKILLNEAVLRCTRKLTIGVTDTNMLLSKILWELIQPVHVRIDNVKNYLMDIDPTISYDVVPIQDPFGPTKSDPSFQLIVVSSETIHGGNKVNEIRILNHLRTLEIHAISLVCNGLTFDEEEDKISSSNIRMRQLGKRLRPLQKQKPCPRTPYVIGLTGGIGSGKSSISERLAKLGAGIIDCDKVSHDLYLPGTKLHEKLIATFGPQIVTDSDSKLINRKVLGSIVFNDKNELEKLNSLVWPAIFEACIERIKQLKDDGCKVVIIEAAVLLKAGWDRFCHEVWVSIVPPEEAVKRLIERNKLTEEDARSRLAAQPSNCEYVKAADIVFSTYWSTNFTQKQVESAWQILQDEILNSPDSNTCC